MNDLRATCYPPWSVVSRADSALGAVGAFRPPAASSLCVLTQPRPSTEPAGASSGESRVVLHAMQLKAWPGVARGGSTSSFVGRLSPTVVPNRWLRAPDLAPRSSLAILVGPRRPAQRPRPPLPLRGEPRSPASSACSPLHLDGDFRGKPCPPEVARLKQAWRLLTSQSINLRYRRTPVFRCRSR